MVFIVCIQFCLKVYQKWTIKKRIGKCSLWPMILILAASRPPSKAQRVEGGGWKVGGGGWRVEGGRWRVVSNLKNKKKMDWKM